MKGSPRVLNIGRNDTRLAPHKQSRIQGSFVIHGQEMRLSPAWSALKPNDKSVLERLELEHMAHGGRENGNLSVTYTQFEEAGIRRHAIAASVARLEALGFIELMDLGKAAWSDIRKASVYRLTYLQGNLAATHEWRTVKDEIDAQRRIGNAMSALARRTRPLRARLKNANAEKRARKAKGDTTPPDERGATA